MRVEPARGIRGEVEIPGDKSISHRFAILGAMAEGRTRIDGFSESEDCHSTLRCIEALGCSVEAKGSSVAIHSPGWTGLRQPSADLDAGNSGTTIRLLAAVLAAQPFLSVISGDSSLNRRPMARITAPLTRMGAGIEAREGKFPPLRIQGGRLTGIRFQPPVASAQVKSCVLLAGLMASGETTVVEETPTRDHTERALPAFGASVEKRGTELRVQGPTRLVASEVAAPGDLSSAAFFVAAALLLPESRITIRGVGVNPSRTGLLCLLEDSGAPIRRGSQRLLSGEPVCDLEVRFDPAFLERLPQEIDGRLVPNLIDEIPILAILGARSLRGLRVREASELRKKESDRIDAIVSNLRRIGVATEEFEDGFHILPNQKIRGGSIECREDHRIAMAFAVAGLASTRGVEIDNPACAAISFPGFFPQLEALAER